MKKVWKGALTGGIIGVLISLFLIIFFLLGISQNSNNFAVNFFGAIFFVFMQLTGISSISELFGFVIITIVLLLLVGIFSIIGIIVNRFINFKRINVLLIFGLLILVSMSSPILAYVGIESEQNGLINIGDECNFSVNETKEIMDLCDSLVSNKTKEPEFSLNYIEETAQREFILDAPYKSNNQDIFPILLGIRDADGFGYAYSFYSIDLIDKNNNEIVYSFSLDELNLSQQGTCFGTPYSTINSHTWFKLLLIDLNNIPLSVNQNNEVNFTIKFDGSVCGSDGDAFPDNEEVLIVKLDEPVPKLDNWYCGDTHYHSSYTDTKFPFSLHGEFGAPIYATNTVIDYLNIDWFTATDHSNSFSSHKEDNLELTWENFKSDCNSWDKCLIGTEINCDYAYIGGGNHLLAYDYTTYIEDNFVGIFSPNNPSCESIINNISNQGGFSYAAHPNSTIDGALGIEVASNWKNYSLPFKGLEIWNGDINDGEVTKVNGKDISKGDIRTQDLEEGLDRWKDIILGRNNLNSRKVFISAGSDAHGDFQEMGKEYTCVYAPHYSKSNIFNGLKNGNSFMSNNGALKFELNNLYGSNVILGGEINVLNNGNARVDIEYFIQERCDLSIYEGIIGEITETEISLGDIHPLSNPNTYSYDVSNITSKRYYRLECIGGDGKSRIYTNPIWVTPIPCFENLNCNDENPYTQDTCLNPQQITSQCEYESITCLGDLDCDDSDTMTTDVCHNSGTIQSICENVELEPIIELIINSPFQPLSSERRIQFNITTNEIVDKITYIDNSDSRPREKSLCTRNCNGYGNDRAKSQSFRDGYHNLTFYAIKDNSIVDEEVIGFIVDSKKPRITKTEPRRGFASSVFNVEFREDNPKELILNYGNDLTGFKSDDIEFEEGEVESFVQSSSNDNPNPGSGGGGGGGAINPSPHYSVNCLPEDRGARECIFTVNLSDYNNQEIEYWFELKDIVGNSYSSRETKMDVDTTSPVLNNPNSFWEQGEGRYYRYIYFNFNITEQNFDEINYIDLSDSKPRERRLCSRLRDGICEVKKSFRTGEYNLTINILDDAGNSIEESLSFVV